MNAPAWIHGRHYRSGQPLAVKVEDGLIADLRPAADGRAADAGGGEWIAPGLVDLQINGFNSMDFNTLPIADGQIRQLTENLWRHGVTSFLPTVITNGAEAIAEAVAAIGRACEHDAVVRGGVAGIHLEGPFISPDDGPRGAHNKAYVRKPDWTLFCRWQEACGGRIRLVTLSPEWPEAPEFIRRCTDAGVKAAIGHTKATGEQIARAVDAGASLSTHLGNAAHPDLPRHPNYLWEQLAEERLHATLIADGFHLPPSFLKVALRSKGGKAMLVSDATVLGGMPPGEYTLQVGRTVVKTAEGRLHLAGNPRLLAGSGVMLLDGVAHMTRSGLCALAEAWEMASERPAAFLGLPQGAGLTVGAPADFVVFREEADGLRVVQTYKRGIGGLPPCAS